jgi:PST family polysaccharide transporter
MDAVKNQGNLFKNFFSQSLLQVANNLLPFISIPIIVRIIGPDKYGVINFASVVVSYFIMLTNYAFDLTATRAIAMNKHDEQVRSQIFNEVLIARVLLFLASAAIFLVLLYVMPPLYNEKRVAVYTFLIVLSFVLTPTWLYQGMQQLYNVAIFNFITKLLFTICVVVVIRQKEDYTWQPLLISVAHILVGIGAFVWAVKKYAIKLYYVPLKKVWRHIWNERIMFFSFVSINIYVYASALILGLVRTPADVAFFAAGYRLVTIMHTIVTIPLGMSLFPYIAENFAIGREQGLERIRITAPFVFYLTLLMGLGVWLLSPFIITLIYGQAFVPAIGVLRILCFLPVALGLSNLLGVQTMVNLNMDKPYSRIIVLGSVFGVALNLWLAREFNYIGGAWALLLTEILIVVLEFSYLKKKQISVINTAYFRLAYISDTIRPFMQGIKNKMDKKKAQSE